MIYFVTNQTEMFHSDQYTNITPEKSLEIIKDWKVIQFDTETSGLDPHTDKLLTMQLGNTKGDIQIVVDCTSVSPTIYKEALETAYLEGWNLKFDLQFLYNYKIIPSLIYDGMIVEQLLHLGWPSKEISYSLQATAQRRLNIFIDKTVRGEIIWKGITDSVIIYAAGDVVHLHQLMLSQRKDCIKNNCLIGAKLECDCVPAMAYLEWCGIKLDVEKWKAKMQKDQENKNFALNALNQFIITNDYKQYYHLDPQGNLWTGFNDKPIVDINWDSPSQVTRFAKFLGFDTTVQDRKTGEDKDSVLEKHLKTQKGINDEFLKLYFDYKEYSKACSSFGQGHLDAINPNTHRLHASYYQIGTKTGRMSSGSRSKNDSAKINMQQLPKNAEIRGCFVAEPGNLFCSCDYSAMEARIGADVYNEKTLLDEFLKGSGDSHAAYAKAVFAEELKDIPTKDVKAKRPDLRDKVKSVEFAVQFGSDGTAVAPQLGIPVAEAKQLVSNLLKGMTGLAQFKKKGSKEVFEKGYVLISPITGHKQYWWDWEEWKKFQSTFTSEFWEEYKTKHKQAQDNVALKVREHFKAKGAWERAALNSPTQGSPICPV